MYLTYIISDKSEHVNYLLVNRVIVMREMSCFKFYYVFLFCIYILHIYTLFLAFLQYF